MNIFIDAFVDTNFGDNFFIHAVAARYRKHRFYMIERAGHEKSCRLLQKQEKNIFLLTEAQEEEYLEQMDALWIVGGDLFWDYGIYTDYLRRIRSVKSRHGQVVIMGISLFEQYSETTKADFRQIFSLADNIVVRDRQSYVQIKQIVPEATVTASADMAFTYDIAAVKKREIQKGVLGISVRKKIPRNTEERYETYCQSIAEIAAAYLEKSPDNRVKFLAFSTGEFDDRKTAEKIADLCPEIYRNRMEIVPFLGDVEKYLAEIQSCEKLLCTRFHALAFAIMLQKPFVPIIYEEKMRRLLNEIAYYGIEPIYEEKLDAERILSFLQKGNYSEMELKWYYQKAELFFKQTDEWLLKTKKFRIFRKFW